VLIVRPRGYKSRGYIQPRPRDALVNGELCGRSLRICADIARQGWAVFGTVLGGDHGGHVLGTRERTWPSPWRVLRGRLFRAGHRRAGAGIASQPIFFLLKDELHLSAAETAAFLATISIAWGIKPLYGLLSDFFPLFGYRRKSYLLLMTEPRRRLLAALGSRPPTRTSRSWSRCSSVASGSRSPTSCATPSWWKPASPWA